MWRTAFYTVAGATLFLAAGCEGGISQIAWPGLRSPAEVEHENLTADKMRSRYQTEKDPAAIRWLLAHRVQQGMNVGQVSQILGEDGQRRYDDVALKERNVAFRVTDETYQWGPDNKGQVYVLFFRDGRLVNFNPRDYE